MRPSEAHAKEMREQKQFNRDDITGAKRSSIERAIEIAQMNPEEVADRTGELREKLAARNQRRGKGPE